MLTTAKQLHVVKTIRVHSYWCIKNKKDAVAYVNIGTMCIGPHEAVKVTSIYLGTDRIIISVSHKLGDTAIFNYDRFIELFEEIEYPNIILRPYVEHQKLFGDIHKLFNINLYEYYNESTRTIQMTPETFDIIFLVLEKDELIFPIVSKKDRDYVRYGKIGESKFYGNV